MSIHGRHRSEEMDSIIHKYRMLFWLLHPTSIIVVFLARSLDAICQSFQLELDDIIVLSTDGLFDNVPDRLLEKILFAVSYSFSNMISMKFS
jgi:hypothetical protein